MFIDINERIRAELERQKLQEQLIQAQKMESIGRLAGGVAHDFNNLLTVINGFSEIALQKIGSNQSLSRELNAILSAGRKAQEITAKLLAFSRKQLKKPEVVDLNQVVKEMEQIFKRLITEDIEIKTDLASNLPPILADRSQLEQILTNLVVNARDALDEFGSSTGKLISIQTGTAFLDETYRSQISDVVCGEYIFFSVSDNGQGITPDLQRQVFEPFFTTKKNGTGLGLATVYGIVKQNNAYIYLYSEPGKGTTFKIYWPILKETLSVEKN